jgi:hypothetical protein
MMATVYKPNPGLRIIFNKTKQSVVCDRFLSEELKGSSCFLS